MKYLTLGLFVVTVSIFGMQQQNKHAQPYFIKNNKMEMYVPYGWNSQLESGELVTLCANLKDPLNIKQILTALQTSERELDDLFKEMVIKEGKGHILGNCRHDDVIGNVLHVRSLNHYIPTNWYKLGKRYSYGKKYDKTLQVFCIVGMCKNEIKSIPIRMYQYQKGKAPNRGQNKAEVVYFEPHDYENDSLNESGIEGAL